MTSARLPVSTITVTITSPHWSGKTTGRRGANVLRLRRLHMGTLYDGAGRILDRAPRRGDRRLDRRRHHVRHERQDLRADRARWTVAARRVRPAQLRAAV